MADSFVQLPADTGNTGKKIHTRTRVIGADTVHEHYFIPTSDRADLGAYMAHSGNLVIQAAAHTLPAGFLWLFNPIAATVNLAVRRINCIMQHTSALSTPTAPRVVAARFSSSTDATGAAITPAKRATADATPQGTLRTANTGLTITNGAIIGAVVPPASQGTAGWAAYPAMETDLFVANDEDDQIILVPGEGIAIYQADAGTTSDVRKLVVDFRWYEYTP